MGPSALSQPPARHGPRGGTETPGSAHAKFSPAHAKVFFFPKTFFFNLFCGAKHFFRLLNLREGVVY